MIRATALALLLAVGCAQARVLPTLDAFDPRVRSSGSTRILTVAYNPDEVIELRGFKGYTLDLQWAEDEKFVSISSGMPAMHVNSGNTAGEARAAIFFANERNVLSLKPGVPRVSTNLTVFTSKRIYRFEYTASESVPAGGHRLHAIRFSYPEDDAKAAAARAEALKTQARLAAQPAMPRNTDYWFCGAPSLRPESAWDDGVQTHLRFSPGTEFPSITSLGDDGAETLVNLNVVNSDEAVLHRISKRFILRRGELVGCVVNKSPAGVRLPSNAMAPGVERTMREAP